MASACSIVCRMLPAGWREWPTFAAETAPLYIHRLGNQALMIKTENKKIGNKPFSDKKPVLAQSSLKLTNQIGAESNWTSTEIAARQVSLATVAVSVWKRTI